MKIGVLSKLNTILILLITHLKYRACERRVINGKQVFVPKRYMVYVIWEVKSPNSDFYYFRDKDTLCGGVIVNPLYILSSGACLKMKIHQFVVAGYNRYLPIVDIANDACYKISGRTVIRKCYVSFERKLEGTSFSTNVTKWTDKDIGLAMIHKPFEFEDRAFLSHCPYLPTTARFNYDIVKPGTEVVIIGWGARKYHRPGNYAFNVNEEFLMYTSTVVIVNTEICKEAYEKVNVTVDTKICTDGVGHLEANGTYSRGSRRYNSNSTKDKPLYVYDINNIPENYTVVYFHSQNGTRRNGPCENDHGGPLISWIEGVEYVVGTVVGYLVDRYWRCVGPFIYEPLASYQHFVECATLVLKNETNLKHCEALKAQRLKIREENIDWA